jgi:hypothetical protein
MSIICLTGSPASTPTSHFYGRSLILADSSTQKPCRLSTNIGKSVKIENVLDGLANRCKEALRCPMSIQDAVARDLVAVLFVTFMFGGGALWLIVATIAEQWRKLRMAERNASIKQSMIEGGYRADEIVRVLNAGSE